MSRSEPTRPASRVGPRPPTPAERSERRAHAARAGPRPVPAFREIEAGAGAIREAALRREGWTRRFVGAPPRLDEARDLYERLGLEVRFEPPGPGDLPADCGECPAASALFRVVYTRSRDRTRSGSSTRTR